MNTLTEDEVPAVAPPFPSGWNKTLRDLIAERRSVSADEFAWARAYERAKLRSWARFPRDGEIYEALCDMPVSYITHWRGPFTGGDTGTLRAGTRVVVHVGLDEPEPVHVHARPLDAARIEEELVSETDRRQPNYAGFSLTLSVEDLNKRFRRLAREAASE
jgi:hypothetical protein